MQRWIIASALVTGVALTQSPARAELTTGTVLGLAYSGSNLAGVITATGSAFALETESQTAQRTWGLASAVTGTLDGGWSAALLCTSALQHAPSGWLDSMHDATLMGGTLSLFIAVPNLLMSLTEILRADGLSPFKKSQISFGPISMKAMQGPDAQGMSVSGAF